MLERVFNFAAFYVGWFACVVGAACGWMALGPLVVAGILGIHLMLSGSRARDLRLAVAVGLLGFTIDTLLGLGGILWFGARSPLPWLCPPWLVAVWVVFATTLHGSMGWLSGRYVLGAILGAITGPLSYYYGVRLGAVVFPDVPLSLTVLAVVWAGVMPMLLHLAAVLGPEPLPVAVPEARQLPA